MATKTLAELIEEATADELSALRDALTAQPAAPARPELSDAERRRLHENYKAAQARVSTERPKLVAQLAEATARRDQAQAEMRRLGALLDGLDFETGATLNEVYAIGWAGRPAIADELLAELRAEVEALVPQTVIGPAAHNYPGAPPLLYSNLESTDRRRAALLALGEAFERAVARCEAVTATEMRAFLAAGRKALPPLESPADVRDRVLAARSAA
jgi:hypothetical protein